MTSATRRPATAPSLRQRLAASAAALLFAMAWLSAAATPVLSAAVTMTAEAMLGGHVRPGAWTAIRVSLANDGPPVTGELRLAGKAAGRSTYGMAVDLPTTARKEYTLYAHSPIFGGKIDVTLVSGDQTIATASIAITGHDQYQPIVVVVAERPQSIVPDISAATVNPNGPSNAAVVTLAPTALPRRVEAWTAIDRLVWQDVDSGLLDADQLAAMASWVAAGGRLVIAGGTTGTTTLSGFPADLLPFQPRGTVEVEPAELATMLGSLPVGAAKLPALEGTLIRGTVLARSPNGVIAAEADIGSGSVTLIGFDPATSWLKGSTAARAVWRRVLPSSFGQAVNPLLLPDDSQIVNALNQLPSVDLPPIDQLFILLLAYIALVGPLNYLVLRRLDRREWAWITMPVLVAVFAVAAYTLGVGLKGSDVIINEVGIVRGAQGTERGLGQVYIGVFSPTRARYDVKVSGGALLSNPISQLVPGAVEQPLDVVFGDPSRLRDYQVGFGQLRGFRAETAVAAPKVDSDLHLDGGRLKGTLTNRSTTELQAAAIVFGGSVAVLGSMPPGSQQTIDIAATGLIDFQMSLSDRLYGQQFTTDPAAARRLLTRRAVIDQLTIYSQKVGGGTGLGQAPMLVAWDPHPALDVDIGDDRVTRVGETLYLTPLVVNVSGRGIFAQGMITSTMIASDAAQANDQGNGGFDFGHGTMTVEYRPIAFAGSFTADKLKLRFTQGEPFDTTPDGNPVDPLPPDRQPSQDDPTGSQLQPNLDGIPAFQLFDRTTGTWQEFAHVGQGSSVMINHPERYVDASGSLLVRFVNRSDQQYFQIVMRLEGTIS